MGPGDIIRIRIPDPRIFGCHFPWRCNPLRFGGGGACERMRVREGPEKGGAVLE
jgi:hypothetical protein